MLVKIVYDTGSIEAVEALRYEQNAWDCHLHIWPKDADDYVREISVSVIEVLINENWVYHRGDWVDPKNNWMIKDRMDNSIFYAKWYNEKGDIECSRKMDKAEYDATTNQLGRPADEIAFTSWRKE